MREALHIERLRVGRGGNLETSTQLGSSPAYLTSQMFKTACACLSFTNFMGILRIRAIMKGVLKGKWAREVPFH